MAKEEIKQMEQARLAALRDFDDDDDPNQNRSAIDIGRDNVWKEQVAVQNVDGTQAETAFDGYLLIGTNREILSWPGDSGEYYLVKTEGDEAKAQARLKKERNQMRQASLDAKAEERQESRSGRGAIKSSRRGRRLHANRRSRRSGGIESPADK